AAAATLLQQGRERTRWRDHVYLIDDADSLVPGVTATQTVEYVLFSPAGIAFSESTRLGTDADPTENYLGTLTDGSAAQFLADGSAGTMTLSVRAMIKA